MVVEFLRLVKTGLDDAREEATLRCELPDADSSDDDAWLECGEVVASAEAGVLVRLDIQLGLEFIAQLGEQPYDIVQLVETIILWVGWETPWLPAPLIEVAISAPDQRIQCSYLVESNRIVRASDDEEARL